ncbi:MAG: bifunctional riboflavin kinase/FAD synthetase [Bacteroidia bacterium]|nr:MAG: bifunctional riboflavin kinase/FAD synthetase [Bacteroidia bacterium]
MIIHRGYRNLGLIDPVITMGVFDGVHRGHRMLLGRVVELARQGEHDAVAVTFDPHPRIVLSGNPSHLRFLTDIDERTALMAATGIGHLVIIEFTPELSRMTASEFLSEVLCSHLGVSHLVTGFNHHFGKRHEGTSDTIMKCSQRMDFTVSREEAFLVEGKPVSSSWIRDLLTHGNVEKASELLGYGYSASGRVVSGKKIGRGLGFPTANIEVLFPHKLIPGDGVYAVEIETKEFAESLPAMLNIGTNPTIRGGDGRRSVEAHLIDFEGDLYDKILTVRFCFRLRDELKYDSVEELAAQMKADRIRTLELLRK